MNIETMIKSGNIDELSIAMNILGINHTREGQHSISHESIEVPFNKVLNNDVINTLNLCNKYNFKVRVYCNNLYLPHEIIINNSRLPLELYNIYMHAPDDILTISQIKDILKDNCIHVDRKFNQF